MLAAGEEEARRAQGNFAPIVKVEHSLDASFIPHSGAYCPFDMDVSRRNLTHKQTKIILPRHVLKAKHTGILRRQPYTPLFPFIHMPSFHTHC